MSASVWRLVPVCQSRVARPAGRRYAIGCAIALTLLGLRGAPTALAHVPLLSGKLVDAVRRSDIVVAGTVDKVVDLKARRTQTTVRVERTLLGTAPGPEVTFDGAARFVRGQRYVFFLRREGSGFAGVQASGVLFPSRPQDDATYARTISGIRKALQTSGDEQISALRAALVPALSAEEPALRYHAALELAAIAHHGSLSPAERKQVEALAANPATDPKLKPFLAALLKTTPQREAGSRQSVE